MDLAVILPIIEKGLTLIPILIQAGEDVAPAIKVLLDLITGAQAGTVTQDQLTAAETQLDALIADFNEPMS